MPITSAVSNAPFADAHRSAANYEQGCHIRDHLWQTSVRKTVDVTITVVDACGVVGLDNLTFCPDVSTTKGANKKSAFRFVGECRSVATRK